MHISGIAYNAVSFSGVVISLNNNEPNNIYLSASTSTLHIVLLKLGNLFCVRYRYKALKYGLFRYPTCISFTVTGRCLPFNSFLCIIFKILSISVYFSKYFWTTLLVLIKTACSGCSNNWDLSSLWYILILYPPDMDNFPQSPY